MKRRKNVHIPLRGTVFFHIQANTEEKDNYLTTTTTTKSHRSLGEKAFGSLFEINT